MSPAASKNQTSLPSVTGVHDVASLYEYAMGLGLPLPCSVTDHRILPVARSMAWPRTSTLSLLPEKGGKVLRKRVSPETAIPPWPSLGRGARHRTFWLAATLHRVGASATSIRKVPSGPPACGQLATATGGVGGAASGTSTASPRA